MGHVMKPTVVCIVLAWMIPVVASEPVPFLPVPLLPSSPGSETAPGLPVNGPRIQFAELVHDFGKVEAGAVIKHDFVFTNTGNAALEITAVRPGCGCTTAGAYDKRVEPGKTGCIPLQLNTTGFSGALTKTATVTCNATGQTNIFLQMKALVWRPIEVNPPSVYFNMSAETATNETRVMRILNNLGTPITLSPPENTNKAFRAELATVREGKEYELRVTAQPALASGYAHTYITLKTSHTNTPLLSIPVSAYVQPVIAVSPVAITLPPGPLSAPVSRSVTIRNTGTNALVLSEPAINIQGASSSLKELQKGKVFTVTINVPAGLQLAATQPVELSLKSNHPRFPVVRVPVIQQRYTAPIPTASSLPLVPSRPRPVAPPSLPARPLPRN